MYNRLIILLWICERLGVWSIECCNFILRVAATMTPERFSSTKTTIFSVICNDILEWVKAYWSTQNEHVFSNTNAWKKL